MDCRPTLLILMALAFARASAQNSVPVATYQLHAEKEYTNGLSLIPQIALPTTVLALDGEQSLLAFIPQVDGKWVLKQLRGWGTKNPVERSLTVVGNQAHTSNVSSEADLLLSKDQKYLLARINYRHGAIESSARNREAVISIIDMNTFTTTSTQNTSDPLVADSRWQFTAHNELIATALEKRFTSVSASSRVVRDHYVAAELELPSLDASSRCQYDSTIELRNGGSGWTKPVVSSISNDCAAVVAEADVRSIEDLPGSQPANHDRLNFALGCQTASLDEHKGLALIECRNGKSYADGMFVSTSSHEMDVISLTSKKVVFSLPLSHSWRGVSGILATIGQEEYVILVEEGINIRVYRLAS